MDIIEKKIIADYWVEKLKELESFDCSPEELFSTYTISVEVKALKYFLKLTSGNEIAKYTVFLTVFSALLQRYFESNNLIFSKDALHNIDSKKNIPLIYSLEPIQEFELKQYLQNVKEEVQQVYKYANYDKKLIKKRIGEQAFENYTPFGLSYNENIIRGLESQFLLQINKRKNGGLELCLNFAKNFVEESVAYHFLENYKKWIENLETNTNKVISKISILSKKEEKQLLKKFNDTVLKDSKIKTIIDLFEEQVSKTPRKIAVVFNKKKFTYSQINEQANQLALYLNEIYTIGTDDFVGIKLDRNEQLIVSVLAVLKSGAAYVPIDIDYPKERIQYIERDSNSKVIIDEGFLDKFGKIKQNFSKENPGKISEGKDLAYIIYTSGTTGKPKGVMIMHQNVLALIHWAKDEFDSTNFDIVYASTSHCFDLSVFEMFYPLAIGSKIRVLKNALEIGEYLKDDTKVLLNTVPSVIRKLLEDEPQNMSAITVLNLAGEPFPVDITSKLLSYNSEVRNLYGPSEDTTYSTCYKLSNNMTYTSVSIGRPITNTQVYILDNYMQLVPLGVIGKLYVSGAGVAKGYLNRSELTARKFIKSPFFEEEYIYDTGDFARWLPDENIEFLGRKDYQIKLRGYRIELGEIENSIVQFSKDIQQVVLSVKQTKNEKELVAYYVSILDIDKFKLRNFLQKRLPSYMIPSYYVSLKKMPLTLNGKIDRRLLPEITSNVLVQKDYVAPRNEIERQLIEIWQEVLGIDNIGIKNSFFELGGHSLLVGQIINRVYKKLNKSISFKSFFETLTIEGLSEKLLNITYNAIPQASVASYYPLTTSQYRIWVLNKLEGGDLAYNMPGTVKLKGNLDILKFEEAFKALIRRHEILRTNFKVSDSGDICQYITPENDFEFKLLEKDVTNQSKEEVKILLQEEHAIVFDLENELLLKATLFKIQNKEYIFILTMHHIIGDGWSLELLISEVIKSYNNLVQNKVNKLPKLTIQYKDYAVWLNKELTNKRYKVSEAYWLSQFQNELPVIDLPSFKSRPKIKTFNGNTLTHCFSSLFLEKLNVFSKSKDVTLFMTLMSGINALLYRYTNQNDIIVGTPIAGREHPDLEGQIGLYLNTLAIRTIIEDSWCFLDLLEQQKQTLLSAYEYQNYPFDELVNKLNLKRDASRSALFDVMIVFQSQRKLHNIKANSNLDRISVEDFEVNRKTSQFDMSFTFIEKKGLELSIEYNTDIYDAFLIERMFTHYQNLMNLVIHKPKDPLLSIDYITEKEKKELIKDINNTTIDFRNDKTIVDLFEEQVKKTPNNAIVVFEDNELTYIELNEKANQLALYLRIVYSIKPDDLIGIKLERSENLIVSIIGILKSGGAYVPIDVNYPKQRIKYIENDSNCRVVIDRQFIEKFDLIKEEYSKENIKRIIQPNNLAYIIYTSGTTGNPKGVMLEHKNLVNLIYEYNLEICSTSLTCKIIFDVSVLEIFSSITSGSTLYIPREEVVYNPSEYARFLYFNRISHCYIHPMHLKEIGEHMNSFDEVFLKRILIGVEGIKPNSIEWYQSKNVKITNAYGPTEATIYSTSYKVDSLKKITTANISIGVPIANSQIYILNEKTLGIQPIGVIGELYISGIGLARGYWNRAKLTSKVFVNHPFIEGELIYKTGDLARWLPSGNIDFIGRKDTQVKIRGHRIELGEIEQTLMNCSKNFHQVIVIAKEIDNEKVLIAYYVAFETIKNSDLRNMLLTKIPQYMIPRHFIEVPSIPLTPNGKIDRKALLVIETGSNATNLYVAPKTTLEIQLSDIWGEILDVEKIGVTDDFFELGGHSLKAVRLINKIEKIGYLLTINDIFKAPTILKITPLLKESFINIPKLSKAPELASYSVTSSQRRIWTLSQFDEGSVAYNIYSIVKIEGLFEKDLFQQSINRIVARHESLRTVFKIGINDLKQFILPVEEVENIIEIHKTNKEEEISLIIEKHINHLFDLTQGPLLKIAIITIADKKQLLLFNLHHIIGDGWSMEVLSREIVTYYNNFKKGIDKKEIPLTIQSKDYAYWYKIIKQPRLFASKIYWHKQLSGELPVIELPIAKLRPRIKTYSGNQITHTFTTEFLNVLKIKVKEQKTTLFTGLLAGINGLFYRYTGQTDIVLGIPIAGRNQLILENQIGLYLNTIAIRTRFESSDTFEELIEKQKEVLLKSYLHQDYPFDVLVDDLSLKRDTSRSALFDVMVVLNNQQDIFNKRIDFVDTIVSTYPTENLTSQFDISFYFMEEEDNLKLSVSYNTDIYNSKDIKNLVSYLEHFILDGIHNDEYSLARINYVPNTVKQQLLSKENIYFEGNQVEHTLLDFIENQSRKTPKSIALVYGNKKIKYQELERKSNELANFLITNYTISLGDLIGIKLDRNEWLVISIIAVLKTGAAYVPLDINYPEDRIQFIESDSSCIFSITDEIIENFKKSNTCINKCPKIKIESNDLAYVIYTSGSTGKPKGVMLTHSNVCDFLNWCKREFFNTDFDIMYAVTSHCFDLSIYEMFYPLSIGKSLRILSNGLSISEYINIDSKILINTVPSVVESLLEEGVSLKNVVAINMAGEPIPILLSNTLCDYSIDLRNLYGPSEDTTYSSCYRINKKHNYALPIGKPIRNTRFYILSEELALQGEKLIGEICISGKGLSKGYLNKEKLTKEKFIDNPFETGTKLYRTGDLGYWMADGNIGFVGRKDSQIKLRGYRIELGEIEYALQKEKSITQAVVLIKEFAIGKYITCYLTGKKIDFELIYYNLLKKLPSYMVPYHFLVLKSIPLSPNGKVDKKELLKLDVQRINTSKYVEPRTEIEKQLALIWKTILGISSVGILDNFFELGGHSLHINKMLYEINETFDIKLKMKDVFKSQNINELAQIIDKEKIFGAGVSSNKSEEIVNQKDSEVWEI